MITRGLSTLSIAACAIVLSAAGQSSSPAPSPSDQRIYLTGAEVKALTLAYTAFAASKDESGNVPLQDLLVNVRHLTDGYHVDFVCYPSAATSWTYQYIVDPVNFGVRLAGKGISVFHN